MSVPVSPTQEPRGFWTAEVRWDNGWWAYLYSDYGRGRADFRYCLTRWGARWTARRLLRMAQAGFPEHLRREDVR